jgi:hypothetical protein
LASTRFFNSAGTLLPRGRQDDRVAAGEHLDTHRSDEPWGVVEEEDADDPYLIIKSLHIPIRPRAARRLAVLVAIAVACDLLWMPVPSGIASAKSSTRSTHRRVGVVYEPGAKACLRPPDRANQSVI